MVLRIGASYLVAVAKAKVFASQTKSNYPIYQGVRRGGGRGLRRAAAKERACELESARHARTHWNSVFFFGFLFFNSFLFFLFSEVAIKKHQTSWPLAPALHPSRSSPFFWVLFYSIFHSSVILCAIPFVVALHSHLLPTPFGPAPWRGWYFPRNLF